MSSETIISIDVETDGPIPGANSMLSLGAVAFDGDTGIELASFQGNMFKNENAAPNDKTMEWWETQPEAWEAITTDQKSAQSVMDSLHGWLRSFKSPVAVGYPVTFDFMFVYWYLMQFCGNSPLGFQGKDIKTMASIALGVPYKQATKRNFPKRWFKPGLKHTHIPVDDAREQGYLYFSIKQDLDNMIGMAKSEGF